MRLILLLVNKLLSGHKNIVVVQVGDFWLRVKNNKSGKYYRIEVHELV